MFLSIGRRGRSLVLHAVAAGRSAPRLTSGLGRHGAELPRGRHPAGAVHGLAAATAGTARAQAEEGEEANYQGDDDGGHDPAAPVGPVAAADAAIAHAVIVLAVTAVYSARRRGESLVSSFTMPGDLRRVFWNGGMG